MSTPGDTEKLISNYVDEGTRLFNLGQYTEALDQYHVARKHAQQYSDKSFLIYVNANIGLVHLVSDNVEEAEQLFDEVRTTPEEKTPSNNFKNAVIHALHGKASILIDRKDFQGAITITEQAIEMNSNVALSYFLKGEALFLDNQFQDAGRVLSTCRDLADPKENFFSKATNYLELISALIPKKPNPIVERRFSPKNSSHPGNPNQRNPRNRKKPKKQLAVLPPTSQGEQLLKHPEKLMANDSVLKGDRLLQEGHIEQAIRYYLSALEKNPGNIPALLGLGNAEIGQRNFKKAISYLDRALETAQKTKTMCWEAMHSKVIALFQSNNHDLAITISSQILDQSSLPPEVKNIFQCTLGILFFYQGKYSKTHNIFEPLKEKYSKEQKSFAPLIVKNHTETCYNSFCFIFFALNQKFKDFYLSQATAGFKDCLSNNPDRSIKLLCTVGLFLAKNLATQKKLLSPPGLQEAIAYKEEEYFLLLGIFYRSTNHHLESLKFFNHAIELGLISPHILNQKITTLTHMIQYYQIGEKSTDRNIKKQQPVMLVKIIAGFQEVLIHDPGNKDAQSYLETLTEHAKTLRVAIPSPMAAPKEVSNDSTPKLENKTEPLRDLMGSSRLMITILSPPRQNDDEKLSLCDSPLTLTSTPQQNHVRFGAQPEYQFLPGVVTQPDSPNPVSPTESASPSNISSNNSPENASSCNSPTSHSPLSFTPMLKPKSVGSPPEQMNWHRARFIRNIFNHAPEDPHKGIPVDPEIVHASRNRCTIL